LQIADCRLDKLSSNLQSPISSPPHLVRAILAVLFLGPLMAPLFQATSLQLAAGSGALARDLLSRYVCPTPAKSYALLGFPMAVCARCWGATIGLWAAWLLIRSQVAGRRWQVAGQRQSAVSSSPAAGGWRLATGDWRPLGAYVAMAWPVRLVLGALPLLLWVAEIRWWAAAPYWVLLLNGTHAGFWAGLCFCSLWPDRERRPQR
jgi:hypothetical protein